MTKFKSFISWFPKFFEKATHEENLMEISESLSNTLVNSKMKGMFLSPEDIGFILIQLKKDLKIRMEIKVASEKTSLEWLKDATFECKDRIKKINELMKSL